MADACLNTPTRTIELFASAFDAGARADIEALKGRTITGGGLATGGGDLTTNRVITVPKASGAEAVAGTDDAKAITSLALAMPVATLNAAIDAEEAARAAADTTIAGDLAAHEADAANPHVVTKAQIGLGNVDNTSDANKPVSSAAQTALNLKANIASPTLTDVPAAPTAGQDTNSTQLATTAFAAAAAVAASAATERPGDAVGLYGSAVTGAPSTVPRIDDAWITASASGNVIRVDGATAADPQIVAPVAASPIEAGRSYDLRWKVQRQTDPVDPLNDSVSLKIRWLDKDKVGIAGGGGTTTVEDIALVAADGVQERTVRIALAAGVGVDHVAPANTVYCRPYVEMFGASHVTDVNVIDRLPAVAHWPLSIADVRDFGAVGDGIPDDVDAFTAAAVSAAADGESATIVVPPGTYKLSAQPSVGDRKITWVLLSGVKFVDAAGEDSWPGLTVGTTQWGFYTHPNGEVSYLQDRVDNDVLAGGGKVNGYRHNLTFGGATVTGGRHGGYFFVQQNAPTSAANPDRNYVAVVGQVIAASGDGGTGIAAGQGKGGYFGGNFVAHTTADAKNLLNVTGGEFNTKMPAGSTCWLRTGLQAVSKDDGVATISAGVAVGASTDAVTRYQYGILVGAMFGGPPLATTGTLIGTEGFGNPMQIGTGIDFSAFTINDDIFKCKTFNINKDGHVRIGSTAVTSVQARVDFHSIGSSTYDMRIETVGGSAGNAGQGEVRIRAGLTRFMLRESGGVEGEGFRLTPVSASVNFVDVLGGNTGLPPEIRASGTDTNIDLLLSGKGTGAVRTLGSVEIGKVDVATTRVIDLHSSGNNVDYDSRIEAAGGTAIAGEGELRFRAALYRFFVKTAGGTAGESLRLSAVDTAVNVVDIRGAAAAGTPSVRVDGSDTNISLAVQSKGTGTVALRDGNAVAKIGINSTGIGFFSTPPVAAKTGWGTATGTAARTTYATHTGQTITGVPTQAEVQAIDDHLVVLSQRVKALIDDLHQTAGYGLLRT